MIAGMGGMVRESGGGVMKRQGKLKDEWIVGGHRFSSRLLMGTGKFQDAKTQFLASTDVLDSLELCSRLRGVFK